MSLKIIMYHYVRPIQESAFPEIKGLELSAFQSQIERLARNYEFVTAEQLMAAVRGDKKLPENSCLLTFDDGYTDHFEFVFPYLLGKGIQGVFFPPVCSASARQPLTANLLHFILASRASMADLIESMEALVIGEGVSSSTVKGLKDELMIAGRFDDAETIYFKRMLQKGLPERIRAKICSLLFEEYDGRSIDQFVCDLYMTEDDLKKMIAKGMAIGSHGYRHDWLDAMTSLEQKNDLLKSFYFLKDLGIAEDQLMISYPYGGFNSDTVNLCEELGVSVGFTVESRSADLAKDHRLLLPRIDTNEI